jgi:hypothetical protein
MEVRLHRLAALLALALFACGNPDNQVFGGISGPPGVPNAYIDNVGSAIHAVAKVTNQDGGTTDADVFVLTDRVDLCKKLGSRPDYFQNPSEAFVGLVMATTFDRAGTFRVGTDASAVLMVTAGPGNEIIRYPPAAGLINVRQVDVRGGGEGDGSFDLIFGDFGGGLHSVFGKFKTRGCAALANLTF